jgi:hypothetical protein
VRRAIVAGEVLVAGTYWRFIEEEEEQGEMLWRRV